MSGVRISAIIPCLDEEATVGTCVRKARKAIETLGGDGEVLVVDNGSSDRSAQVAASEGAHVIHEPRRGYGAALLAGFGAAKGRYLVMADADDTYDLSRIPDFIAPLERGADLVIGDRLGGAIEPGAMPWHHRWVGVPLLSFVLNRLFGAGIRDAHCGMRAITAEAWASLRPRTTGMEFASEMLIRAARQGLRIEQIPITLHRGGRPGRPHLRSFRDGWRHLKMMFMLSPTHLFLVPGAALFLAGAALLAVLAGGPLDVHGFVIDYHFMILGSLLAVLGFNVLTIGLFARIYALVEGLEEKDPLLRRLFGIFNLERGLLAGAAAFLAGLGINVSILVEWIRKDFSFGGEIRVRPAILGLTLMVIGGQAFFSSFFFSILGTERRREP
ncbi:MAG TPA: glycosyltransferase family 2 protein [Candidatus Saccharimonadales bacterium]|nr:glycosyltransferase family 2 protein [Candidatus Saccharimonadales bacterium]